MPLVQIRVDDRLIHGQVIVGWRNVLKPQRILLCSDEVANSDWQRKIYMSAVPEDIKASVLTFEQTVQALKKGELNGDRTILLVDTPKTIVDFVNAGVEIKHLNIGGMHFKPGKNEITPFIFVDQNDIESFKFLHKKKITLEGQDVPTRRPIDIARLLNLDEL